MNARDARLLTLTLLLAVPLTTVRAQATAGAPDAARRLPALWIGTGFVAGHANSASVALATNAGGQLSAAIELPQRATVRRAQLALRVEGGWSQQGLAADGSSGLSGNVQTLSTGLALRMYPGAASSVLLTDATARRVTPYLLAGVGLMRPSTRVLLSIDNRDMPSAQFGQTSSELAATVGGGLGAQVRLGPALLFAEARTGFARLNAGTLRNSFGTLGLIFQPRR